MDDDEWIDIDKLKKQYLFLSKIPPILCLALQFRWLAVNPRVLNLFTA